LLEGFTALQGKSERMSEEEVGKARQFGRQKPARFGLSFWSWFVGPQGPHAWLDQGPRTFRYMTNDSRVPSSPMVSPEVTKMLYNGAHETILFVAVRSCTSYL
jgi:hypothetical protein